MLVDVVNGDLNIAEGAIYEMDVVKSKDANATTFLRRRYWTLKTVPNSMDVVKRAVASAVKDPTMAARVLEITSMFFSTRTEYWNEV